ncbi:MAG TPA: hypothetical protein PLN21_21270 [Gemmatales bacterium]|nr:hypothetical protein [Gemmatales bacterium]
MRTIKTHFLFLTLASLGFTMVAHAEDKGKTGSTTSNSSSKVISGKPADTIKPAKSDPVVKVDTHTTKISDVSKVDIKPKTDVVIKKDVVTKVDIVKKPEIVDKRVVQIHEAGKMNVDAKMPTIKLNNGAKFDHAEFAKLTPKIDLTKVKPETVLAGKPPADFKVTKIGLDKIQLPKDALKVDGLNAGMKFNGEKFIINKNFISTPDYFKSHAVKCSFGYCFPGKIHNHWHHCIWDPCYSCYYYYCPCSCCYYYWSDVNLCYYPAYWFVEYQGCSYPWWLCGGFESFGYCGSVGVSINLGIHIK